MNPRFDVFRKQDGNLVKWVGTALRLDDVEKLVETDAGLTNTSRDRYLVVHSAYGVAETVIYPVSERMLETAQART